VARRRRRQRRKEETGMVMEQVAPASAEEDRLYRKRHSAAHILAQAVLELFPEAKLGIGPPIDTGFYYDFLLPPGHPTPEELERIEARMREVVAADVEFREWQVPKEEARRLFAAQPFKLELIDSFAGETVGLARHDAFTDLCAGRHVRRSSEVGEAFKLMNVAGAYWRGDEHNPMLTRIYGALFETRRELEGYLKRLEEARQRDHRRLGRELGLFTFADDVGPGIPLLLPKGEVVKHVWEEFIRELQTQYGYQHVWTGNIVKEELYRKSGHLEAYADVMFPPMVDEDGQVFRLKPMNCPSHMALYNTQLHSYRELPVRYAEFATLYRYERSGQLSGLTRVRALTQDDCHIFCTPEQVEEEFGRALALIREALRVFGITEYRVRLSLRGEDDGGKYIGDPEQWAAATAALRAALDAHGVEYFAAEGEAAIYGPKADFIAQDVLGRDWQISTIQVDFVQPARLGCEYVAEDGSRRTPVVLHRAVTGSFERFFALLIEHYNGAFPLWLAPVQAVVIPIADRHNEFAASVARRLRAARLRVEVDTRSERMNAKIRDAQLQKVPYMLVVGDREVEADAVNVRLRSGESLGAMSVDAVRSRLLDEVSRRV
jgi:threonyl-tRNA synthetase